MQMCNRCGRKGEPHEWWLQVTAPGRKPYWIMQQRIYLCEDCSLLALDQLSVVISNETWPGDEIRERTREVG